MKKHLKIHSVEMPGGVIVEYFLTSLEHGFLLDSSKLSHEQTPGTRHTGSTNDAIVVSRRDD